MPWLVVIGGMVLLETFGIYKVVDETGEMFGEGTKLAKVVVVGGVVFLTYSAMKSAGRA